MKRKITLFTFASLLVLAIAYQSCGPNDTGGGNITIVPQELPNPGIPDFHFPEDSTNIYQWLAAQDTVSITKHAWGVWAGLTSNTSQIYKGDSLLVYETWLGIEDIADACSQGNKDAACGKGTKNSRERLAKPRQLSHSFANTGLRNQIDTLNKQLVSVFYDPNAACFATQNLLLYQSTINKYAVPGGIGRIPAFPNKGITIKPTYYIGKQTDDLIRIPYWQGPPSNGLNQVYGPEDWKSYIYVDVKNSQPTGKVAVPTDGTSPEQIAAATCNLRDFIYYKIDKEAAEYINKQLGPNKVKEGEVVILVAMHVATKEISNWTWQTFFWTLDPANPPFPSSSWEAALRPSQLKGAAAHYAVSTAYAMVWPNQPITGGTNVGVRPIIGYNPYLEPGLGAPFGNTNALNPQFQYGLQTNCMSCHAYAALNKNTPYSADQYVDMNDTIFNNSVVLDFAWSIQGNVNTKK